MGIAASDLRQHVIRPTLLYLGRHSSTAEALLLGAAASQSGLGSVLDDRQGHGLYRISELRHQQLWDQHLARDPDLASLVRGLASQHAFLAAPHLELTVNLRYATAIARKDYRGKVITLQRFEEMARFNYGSTVIVLLPKGVAALNPGLHAESAVRLGERLATRL